MSLQHTLVDSTVRGAAGIGGVTLVDSINSPSVLDVVLKLAIFLITATKPLTEIFKLFKKTKKHDEKVSEK